MIKNNRGISVITLIVTIIVLVIITSVTVFTGTKMIASSREKALEDRLKVIYNAIIAHETDLGYGDTVVEKQITLEEYTIMGLEDYADEKNFTPVYVAKKIHDTASNKRVYTLWTLKEKDGDEKYTMESIYDLGNDNINTKIEFDMKKGVNRPQMLEGMIALNTYVDEANDIRTEIVHNVYTEDWYDYSFTTPRWANMEIDDKQYVWIPRFAYKVQDFYLNKDYDNVPPTAISIIFLKETTNYMANNEILPSDYQVHPAFSTEYGELAGIWIAKYQSDDVDTITEAVEKAADMHKDNDLVKDGSIESHLMKNTEWAAMAYLSFVSGGDSRYENTLSNSYGICDVNNPEFVAARLGGTNEKFDIYSYNGANLTYDSNESEKNGDALVATSSGLSEKSAWYKGTTILPTVEKPYVLRRGDESYFAYEAYNGTKLRTCYRNVITITGTESESNFAQIKVGDYVSYEPDTPTPGVSWRVWAIRGNKVIIMPTSPVGELFLGDDYVGEYETRLAKCLNDYNTAISKIEALCDQYACSALGITASQIRSLKLEDLENPKISSLARQKLSYTNGTVKYGETKTYTTGNYFAARYNEITDKNDISSSFIAASAENPITVKQECYKAIVEEWGKISESSSTTYQVWFNSSGMIFLPTPTADCRSDEVFFNIYVMEGQYVRPEHYIFRSNGGVFWRSAGVRPMVTLNGSQLMLNETNPGNGSSTSPWNIVKK